MAQSLVLVQIEDAQQSQVGWLFGRGGENGLYLHSIAHLVLDYMCAIGMGSPALDLESPHSDQTVSQACACAAFDKGDLLYLRDEEEKRRFKEDELRESERAIFLRLQAVAGPGPDSSRQAAAALPARTTSNHPSRYVGLLHCRPI